VDQVRLHWGRKVILGRKSEWDKVRLERKSHWVEIQTGYKSGREEKSDWSKFKLSKVRLGSKVRLKLSKTEKEKSYISSTIRLE
jgi:hypothetical protein